MTNFDTELARVNNDLALAARRAHELWTERYRSPDTMDIERRKFLSKELDRVEKEISSLEEESTLIQRAQKYEDLVSEDAPFKAESKTGNGSVQETIDQIDRDMRTRAAGQTTGTRRTGRPKGSRNKTTATKPAPAVEPTTEPVES